MVKPVAPTDPMDWFQRVLEVPILAFLGPEPVDPRDPAAGVSLLVTEQALNGGRVLHGGVIATVLELAAYLALLPSLGASEQAVTHGFSSSCLSAAVAGETVTAQGSLLRRSRHLAFVSVSMTSGDRLVAVATVTKSILGAATAAGRWRSRR
jgi:uncharacterized protein (TIGR00369 family)